MLAESLQADRLEAEELTPGRDALAADEEKRRSQTIPGLLLSPVEAAVNEGTAARQEIEQVSQSAAHFPNHEPPATLLAEPARF